LEKNMVYIFIYKNIYVRLRRANNKRAPELDLFPTMTKANNNKPNHQNGFSASSDADGGGWKIKE
jgi:hypothetical protein